MVNLSDREFEIMELLAEGITNADIQKRTGLTIGQIENTLYDLYNLFETTNRTQTVLKYLGYIK